MQLSRLASASLITVTLAACGSAGPEGPRGPNDGRNTFEASMDGDGQDFKSVSLRLLVNEEGAFAISLSGYVDPLENAVDDEFSINLAVQIDPAELQMLTLPATLAVDGVARFTHNETSPL